MRVVGRLVVLWAALIAGAFAVSLLGLSATKREPIRSTSICAELDLVILDNAVPVKVETIEGMRRDFDTFVSEATNRCTDGKSL